MDERTPVPIIIESDPGTGPVPSLRQIAEIQRRLIVHMADIQRRHIVITGEEGENGKIGELRRDVGRLQKLLGAVALAAVGSLAGAYKAIDSAGERRGNELARVERLERDHLELRQQVLNLITSGWKWGTP